MDYGQPKLDQSEEAGRQARDTEARKKHGGKQETQRPARDAEASKRRGEKQETRRKARDMEKKKRIHLELRGQ